MGGTLQGFLAKPTLGFELGKESAEIRRIANAQAVREQAGKRKLREILSLTPGFLRGDPMAQMGLAARGVAPPPKTDAQIAREDTERAWQHQTELDKIGLAKEREKRMVAQEKRAAQETKTRDDEGKRRYEEGKEFRESQAAKADTERAERKVLVKEAKDKDAEQYAARWDEGAQSLAVINKGLKAAGVGMDPETMESAVEQYAATGRFSVGVQARMDAAEEKEKKAKIAEEERKREAGLDAAVRKRFPKPVITEPGLDAIGKYNRDIQQYEREVEMKKAIVRQFGGGPQAFALAGLGDEKVEKTPAERGQEAGETAMAKEKVRALKLVPHFKRDYASKDPETKAKAQKVLQQYKDFGWIDSF